MAFLYPTPGRRVALGWLGGLQLRQPGSAEGLQPLRSARKKYVGGLGGGLGKGGEGGRFFFPPPPRFFFFFFFGGGVYIYIYIHVVYFLRMLVSPIKASSRVVSLWVPLKETII